MSGLLYFVETPKPVNHEDVVDLGLGYAFDSSPSSTELTGRTPSGGAGMLFSAGGTGLTYQPESQQWTKMPGCAVYIGYDSSKGVSPDSIARDDQLGGEQIELADGQRWLIPQLRFFSNTGGFVSTLPVRAAIDDAGNWVTGEVVDSRKPLESLADKLQRGMIDAMALDDVKPLTTVELLDIASELLGANYYLSRVEVAHLGLLTNDELLMRIARAAMDYDTALEWASKKNSVADPQEPAGLVA